MTEYPRLRFSSRYVSNWRRLAFVLAIIALLIPVGCVAESSRIKPGAEKREQTALGSALPPSSSTSANATPRARIMNTVKVLAAISFSSLDSNIPSEFHPLDWSPDGKILSYGNGDALWSAIGPEFKSKQVVAIPDGRIGEVYYSPDGSRIAFRGTRPVEDDSRGERVWTVRSDGTELKDISSTLDSFIPKTINKWINTNNLTLDFWRGNGAQELLKANIELLKIEPVIRTSDASRAGTLGGEYYWSPSHEFIAIQDCCTGHIAIIQSPFSGDAKWLPEKDTPPSQGFQAWMPNGNQFLFLWSRGEANTPQLWLWDAASFEGQHLLDHVSAGAPSPSGNQIAVLRQEEGVWNPPDGNQASEAQIVRTDGFKNLSLAIYDPASRRTTKLAAAGYKIDETSGNPRYWKIAPPIWSPDGSLIAYWGDDGNTYLVSSDGSWRQQLTNGLDIVQFLWSPDVSKLALRTMDQAWIIENPKK